MRIVVSNSFILIKCDVFNRGLKPNQIWNYILKKNTFTEPTRLLHNKQLYCYLLPIFVLVQ